MTEISRTAPSMDWNDIINDYHGRVIIQLLNAAPPSDSVQTDEPDEDRNAIRELAAAAASRYRPYHPGAPILEVSQRIADAIIGDMNRDIQVYNHRSDSAADLKHQASELNRIVSRHRADAGDPAHIRDPKIRQDYIDLWQDHAQILAEQADRLATAVAGMPTDNPDRRHLQDTAQYALCVAGTIIKAAQAIYNVHATPPA